MQVQDYLTTEEAAAYLKLKERKLYDLAASGEVPCSKVTGKWLFPRAALDRWIASGLAVPSGFSHATPPPIVGGSHDPLLEWVLRHSGSGLALLSEGSSAGLGRLAAGEAAIAAIHLHGAGDDDANVSAVAALPGLHDAVVVGFARREQGLVVAAGNPLGLDGLASAARLGARFGARQAGAGARLLMDLQLARADLSAERLSVHASMFATGHDLAVAVRLGEIDCGLATRAVAAANGLSFVPLAVERFDLAMRRRTYFEPGPQKVFAAMRTAEFASRATLFEGYDVSEAGAIRFNG